EARCAYVVCLMSSFWMTNAVPLPVTALLPVVLFPLLGVLPTDEACYPYLQETNMLFIGSLIMAMAIEHCNVHKRIALRVMLCVGTNPRWIMLGFMLTTMFMSTWICNTATTAMMMPIVDAVLAEVIDTELAAQLEAPALKTKPATPDPSTVKRLQQANRTLSKSLYLSVAFAANIGGTATLTSAGPNLILKFVVEEFYGGLPPIDYASWLLYSTPGVIISVFVVWAAFQFALNPFFRSVGLDRKGHAAKKVINKKYDELGPITFHEFAVLVMLASLVLLWMFRDPHFARGWSTFFGDLKPKDATAALFVVFFLFVIPADPRKLGTSPTLLTWDVVQKRLPWGVVLLRGGGFAMAEATNVSGLSRWMGHQLASFSFMSPQCIIFVVSVIVAFITEVVSNSATATIFLPIMAQLATDLHLNPLMIIVPVALSCSYAFMLPVGTPANAIVASHANILPAEMILPGLVVKCICICIMLVSINTLGVFIFDLNSFPTWAEDFVANDSLSAVLNRTITVSGH
ncbi:Na+/dicarboxylate, Na+/tricarboxylate and phosphate transporter, putative, partial [Ixodes scapularis]